jgi:hypothetical protein
VFSRHEKVVKKVLSVGGTNGFERWDGEFGFYLNAVEG